MYRQVLLAILLRATELGMTTCHLGMDADVEKSHYGTTIVRNCVYVQARDHYGSTLMREIVAEVGAAAGRNA